MKPDARNHVPRPKYLRELIEATGLTQKAVADRIGIGERLLRYYLSGDRQAPYPVQFAIESLLPRSKQTNIVLGHAVRIRMEQGR